MKQLSRLALLLCSLSLGVGCGGGPGELPTLPPGVEPVYEPPATAGQLPRAQVVAVVDAGLGRFLEGVEAEPVVQGGRFIGFRLITLYPADERFADLDLRPQDIITRVNGQSIEKPDQAFQVFDSLRVASQLAIEYLRGSERRELRFDIVDE